VKDNKQKEIKKNEVKRKAWQVTEDAREQAERQQNLLEGDSDSDDNLFSLAK
jgi:hypothetical protein